jgi:Calcineurin-like phosphoesterase
MLFRMAPFSVGARLMSLSAAVAAIAIAHILFHSCEAVEPETTLADRMMQATLDTTSFWAIADVPYTANDRKILEARLKVLGSDVDFLVHLGDIKTGTSVCNQSVINDMDNLLKSLPVPVLMVIGDNEFNDCINPNQALRCPIDQKFFLFCQQTNSLHRAQFGGWISA